MFLAKVVLGKVYTVSQFAEVKSLPPGYNSVSLAYFPEWIYGSNSMRNAGCLQQVGWQVERDDSLRRCCYSPCIPDYICHLSST
jgi:hypothetical protein